MIEAVREGRQVSIEEYIKLTENDKNFRYTINEVKKEWKRNQPKVYRNKTGQRYWQSEKAKEVDNDSEFQPEDFLSEKEIEEFVEAMK